MFLGHFRSPFWLDLTEFADSESSPAASESFPADSESFLFPRVLFTGSCFLGRSMQLLPVHCCLKDITHARTAFNEDPTSHVLIAKNTLQL